MKRFAGTFLRAQSLKLGGVAGFLILKFKKSPLNDIKHILIIRLNLSPLSKQTGFIFLFTFYRLICVFTFLHLTNGSDCAEPTDGVVLTVVVIFNPRAGKQTAD